MTKSDNVFKVVLLGDAAVGKTSLVQQYLNGTFSESIKITIGQDSHNDYRTITDVIGTKNISVCLWDIGGQDRWASMRPMFMEGSIGALLVFDTKNRQTFENGSVWLRELKSTCPNCLVLLVGNKIDLEDAKDVTYDEGLQYAKEIDAIGYIETSAKTGENIEAAFQLLYQRILEKKETIKITQPIKIPSDDITDLFFTTPITSTYLEQKYSELNAIKDNNTILYNGLKEIDSIYSSYKDKLIQQWLHFIRGKLLISLAQQKIKNNELQVAFSKYLTGLTCYSQGIDRTKTEPPSEIIINDFKNYLFTFFYEIIARSYGIEKMIQRMKKNKLLMTISEMYGDRFFLYFWNSLNLLQTQSDEYYKLVIIQLDKINSIFTKSNPFCILANKTFRKVLDQLPAILIIEKTIDPDPPKFNESAFLKLKVKNILKKWVEFSLNAILDTGKSIFSKEHSLGADEEFEFIIPTGKISAVSIGVMFEVNVKKIRRNRAIFYDTFRRKVEKVELYPQMHIGTPEKVKRLKRTSKIEFSTVIFNPLHKRVDVSINIQPSWMDNIINLPKISLEPKYEHAEKMNLAPPKKTGSHEVTFKLLDADGVTIPGSTEIIQLKTYKSGARLMLEILNVAKLFVGFIPKVPI